MPHITHGSIVVNASQPIHKYAPSIFGLFTDEPTVGEQLMSVVCNKEVLFIVPPPCIRAT